MHAVYLKATTSMGNEMIGKIVDLHRDSVGYWIMVYKRGGFGALRYQHCKLVQGTAKDLGIELLFLPSYSPNLKIIERLCKFTRKKYYMQNIMIRQQNFIQQ
jgi:hypothetical protein